MNWFKALLWATAWSYFAAAIAAILGYPAEGSLPPIPQAILYLFLGGMLFLILNKGNTLDFVNWIWAAFYGILAVLSFGGIQKWINYNGAADYLGVAMAAWDLILAVAIMMEVD